jgi:integrase
MLRYVIPPKGHYRTYRGRFRVGDDPRIYEVSLNTTIKEIAEKRLKERHEEKEREIEGLLPPGQSRAAIRRPVLELFEEYMRDLSKQGRGQSYRGLVRQRFTALVKLCNWQNVRGLTAKSFQDWRNTQTTYEARTLNHYLDAARAFLNWVEATYEISNPLKGVKKVAVLAKYPHGPRAFSEDELSRLFAAAPASRRFAYQFLLLTGLRHEEARQLRWGDVVLGDKPGLVLRSEATKSKRSDALPLVGTLARQLAAMRPSSATMDSPVFPRGVSSYESLKKDVQAAGIVAVDEFGRGVGFHTFRRTFITLGHKFGLAPRVVQQLARHRSATLTNNVYTDTTKLEMHAAVEKLSVILGNAPESLPRSLPQTSGQDAVLVSTNGHLNGNGNGKTPAQTAAKEPLSPPSGFFVQNGEGCSGRDSNPYVVRHTLLRRTRLPIPPPEPVAGITADGNDAQQRVAN